MMPIDAAIRNGEGIRKSACKGAKPGEVQIIHATFEALFHAAREWEEHKVQIEWIKANKGAVARAKRQVEREGAA